MNMTKMCWLLARFSIQMSRYKVYSMNLLKLRKRYAILGSWSWVLHIILQCYAYDIIVINIYMK